MKPAQIKPGSVHFELNFFYTVCNKHFLHLWHTLCNDLLCKGCTSKYVSVIPAAGTVSRECVVTDYKQKLFDFLLGAGKASSLTLKSHSQSLPWFHAFRSAQLLPAQSKTQNLPSLIPQLLKMSINNNGPVNHWFGGFPISLHINITMYQYHYRRQHYIAIPQHHYALC